MKILRPNLLTNILYLVSRLNVKGYCKDERARLLRAATVIGMNFCTIFAVLNAERLMHEQGCDSRTRRIFVRIHRYARGGNTDGFTSYLRR